LQKFTGLKKNFQQFKKNSPYFRISGISPWKIEGKSRARPSPCPLSQLPLCSLSSFAKGGKQGREGENGWNSALKTAKSLFARGPTKVPIKVLMVTRS
jgi:hypothetical protein